MTEFNNKPSYEEIFSDLTILQMTNSRLTNENKRLRKIIQKIHHDQGLEICKYFDSCKSIKDTANNYYFDDVEDCYWTLVEYFGCYDPLQKANDYQEYYKIIFDCDSGNYEEDNDKENELVGEKNTENIIQDLEDN